MLNSSTLLTMNGDEAKASDLYALCSAIADCDTEPGVHTIHGRTFEILDNGTYREITPTAIDE